MDEFLEGQISLDDLLARADVEPGQIPEQLMIDMGRRDMSYQFIWAWCQAAELFGHSQKLTGFLCALLARDNHESHEELADALQNLRSPTTVDCLYDRATRPLMYLEYNDSAALARRCVWALHDIGTPAAISKLELLRDDPREQVSAEASARLIALADSQVGTTKPYRNARDATLGPL